MQSLASILKTRQSHKLPAHQWQQLALDIIASLQDGNTKRSSIFKCCKQDEQRARWAWGEARELGKLHSLYYLKIYNKYAKGNLSS